MPCTDARNPSPRKHYGHRETKGNERRLLKQVFTKAESFTTECIVMIFFFCLFLDYFISNLKIIFIPVFEHMQRKKNIAQKMKLHISVNKSCD